MIYDFQIVDKEASKWIIQGMFRGVLMDPQHWSCIVHVSFHLALDECIWNGQRSLDRFMYRRALSM